MAIAQRVAQRFLRLNEPTQILILSGIYIAGVHTTLLGGLGVLNWVRVKLANRPAYPALPKSNIALGQNQFRLYDDLERITVLNEKGRK